MQLMGIGSRPIKIAGLLILDMLTCLLVFTIWALANISVFPWVVLATIASLAPIHLIVLYFEQIIRDFGVATASAAASCAAGFYLFITIFTRITYLFITPRWYIFVVLLASLVYLSINYGLHASGKRKMAERARAEHEQAQTADLRDQVFRIEQALKANGEKLESQMWDSLLQVFEEFNERLGASTPFGRSVRGPVLEMELQITAKLGRIERQAAQLGNSENPENPDGLGHALLRGLQEVLDLVKNREKAMIV